MSELPEVELPELPQSVIMRMRNNNKSGHYLEATQEALYGRERQLKAALAELERLKAELNAMTIDRDLWQSDHNEDCPNAAMVTSLRASVGGEKLEDAWKRGVQHGIDMAIGDIEDESNADLLEFVVSVRANLAFLSHYIPPYVAPPSLPNEKE